MRIRLLTGFNDPEEGWVFGTILDQELPKSGEVNIGFGTALMKKVDSMQLIIDREDKK